MNDGASTCRDCGARLDTAGPDAVCPACCFALAAGLDGQGALVENAAGLSGQFGEFLLLERLGEGGMGVVYKANQPRLNRVVAVKVLRTGSLASTPEVQRFHIEARAAARLKHPNIVSIHDVGTSGGQPYFSMDYVEGKSLAEIRAGTAISSRRTAGYVKALAEAVHFAHTQGVVHRDLKPSNVLIDSEDQPHLTDFGLAKDLNEQADLTLSGAVFGTPGYMSPEQAGGKRRQIGPATDIYSLGAILYDLLTGRPPFRAETPAETMRQVMELDPAPPHLLNPAIDRDLETICLKCLAKEPHQRYDTARALADDLGRYLRQEPIIARRTSRLTRTVRWTRRNPSLAAALGLAALVFALIAVAAYLSGRDALESVGAVTYAADSVRLRLNHAGDSVMRMASSSLLREMLRTNTALPQPEGQKSMTNVYVQVLSNFFRAARQPSGSNLFENITLLNPDGDLLGNYNENPNSLALTNLALRDYAQGACARTNAYYVSRIYKSRSEKTFKLGVSIALRDGTNLLGVLSGTVGTASTDSPTGIKTDRVKTVLVGELDPLDGGGYVVFWHPAYRRQQESVMAITNAAQVGLLRRILTSGTAEDGYVRINRYYDPVRWMNPKYAGPWVAGFAPVADTRLVVIHQVRDRVLLAITAAGVATGLCALTGLGVFLRRRWLAHRQN